MDKQISLSGLNDELAQVRTKKKEFLDQIERIVPLGRWIAMMPLFEIIRASKSNTESIVGHRSFESSAKTDSTRQRKQSTGNHLYERRWSMYLR